MKDMKLVSGFAVFGFVLSFVSSLFSPHSSFIHKLLMAMLFAVVFGGLGFVIKLIYNKFLNDTDNDLGGDFTSGAQPVMAASAPSKGQFVDIVIQDEEIARGDSENRFVVGESHQMLNDTDVAASVSSSALNNVQSSQTSSKPQAEQSIPEMSVPNMVTEKPSKKEPVESSEPVKVQNSGFVPMSAAALTKAAPAESHDSEGIDTLPDMNSFSFGSTETSSNEDDGGSYSDDDSDFEPSYSSGGSTEVPEIKDAGLIAKAISSVLSDEKSI